MQLYTEDEINLLSAIAAAGGSLEAQECTFTELEELGLVDVQLTGGGWGYMERATLTHEGRRFLGLPVETPTLKPSIRTLLATLFRWMVPQRQP